jgi:hypothetical protein
MWYITKKSFATMYSGMQFSITMETTFMDLAKSTIPGKTEILDCLKLLPAPLSNLATKPLYDSKKDFLLLIKDHMPEIASKDPFDKFLVIKGGVGYFLLGTVSEKCDVTTPDFGPTSPLPPSFSSL